ncbi:Glycosyltransferase involved in cell wall bisynthesis [Nocardioides alpinus]|uniref:Glycosyltransferase family 2 protein n=1 Tax=Nocardioides alpinus TaxID=748909 RepID=A0A1I1B5S5_9ACTN|nr:glycosyltransferase family A protein [Nocardioides alpinus]PKH41344.1 glycosyltransferase family 2 protein [Nocardioides alpinus]SFB45695.1 Glycosyltransferase involved in cell wall bisynthesis [Nocardioides alpinus]
MTKVSIVIPCYNGTDMVHAAVSSALAQTHPETEVIVVNDGSTQTETLRALGELEGAGEVRVIHQDNQGLSAARNRGIQDAAGDYILPLDHDDEIRPTYAAQAAAVLDGQPNVGIVYARAERFGASTGQWDLPDFDLSTMFERNIIHPCGMFRRSDWQEANGYSTDLRVGYEDYDFWIRILGLGRDVVRLDDILFRYRDTVGSMADRMTHRDRVDAFAYTFATNHALYVQHADALAEMIVRHQREWDMLAHFKRRYGRVEDTVARAGALRRRFQGRA